MSPKTALLAAIRAPSPITRWSVTPTWPARMTSSPIRVLPATPTPAISRQRSPDPHVVSHVHQVVELGPAADHRVVDAAAVDARVGADLHVVLQDAVHRRAGSASGLPGPRGSRTPAADDRPGLDDHPGADGRVRVADHSGTDLGVLPDGHAVAERHTFGQPAPVAQAHVSAQHYERADAHALAEHAAGPEAGRGIDAGGGRLRGEQLPDYADEGGVGVLYHDPGARTLGRLCERFGYEHEPRLGGAELFGVPGRDGQRHGLRAGGGERAHRPHHDRPIAKQAATDEVGDRLRGKACRGHGLRCPS